jgi:hypothetical protein
MALDRKFQSVDSPAVSFATVSQCQPDFGLFPEQFAGLVYALSGISWREIPGEN